MQPVPRDSGEMSHESARGPQHQNAVTEDATSPERGAVTAARDRSDVSSEGPLRPAGQPQPLRPAIDPAARSSRRMYDGLSASSAGLELGISVALGALFGRWLDSKLGTEPWLLLVFLVLGLIAGFRGVMRAVARADKAARRE